MLSELTVNNFRSFAESTEIELRPLTLFFGYNNSGKSALLRGLVLLAESLKASNSGAIALRHPAARESRFAELTGERVFGSRRGFGCGFTFTQPVFAKCHWEILEVIELREPVITSFSIDLGERNFLCMLAPDAVNSRDRARRYGISSGGVDEQIALTFTGLFPTEGQTSGTLGKELLDLCRRLASVAPPTEWLTSVRTSPKRDAVLRGAAPLGVGQDGSGTFEILAADATRTDLGPLGKEVSTWYERHVQRRLKVQWESDRFSLETEATLEDGEAPLSGVNLADAGEGLIQVLPVLTALAMVRRGQSADPSVLCIEEPESHLHPRLHAPLAEKFCEVANAQTNARVIVETHSETFLLRLQRAIAEKDLPVGAIVIYWIRQSRDGRSSAEKVTFDPIGSPLGNWPPMVFAEDSKQARLLLDAQRKADKPAIDSSSM